jgi:hypothetical protein
MVIIETCPKCGHDLQDLVICTYPPIPRKECHNCGWSWEGEREEVVRVIGDDIPPACESCSNHPKNGGDGLCSCSLAYPQINC